MVSYALCAVLFYLTTENLADALTTPHTSLAKYVPLATALSSTVLKIPGEWFINDWLIIRPYFIYPELSYIFK
jgi:hypothetical protein